MSGANDKLDAAEAASVVEGFMVFKGIDAKQYPQHNGLKQEEDSPEDEKTHTKEEKQKLETAHLVWDIVVSGGWDSRHNTAVVGAQEDKKEVFVFNNSLSGEDLSHYGFIKGFTAIKKHFFRQSNGSDCGYCTAFFVMHAIQQKEAKKSLRHLAPKDDSLFSQAENPTRGPHGRNLGKLEAAFYLRCYQFSGQDVQGLAQGLDKIKAAFAYKLKKQKPGQSTQLLSKFTELEQSESKTLAAKNSKSKELYYNILSYWLLYDFEFFCFLLENKALGFDAVYALAAEYAQGGIEQKSLAPQQEETCWVFVGSEPSLELLKQAGDPDAYYSVHPPGGYYDPAQLVLKTSKGTTVKENFVPDSSRNTNPAKEKFVAALEEKKCQKMEGPPAAYQVKKSDLAAMIQRKGDGYFNGASEAILPESSRFKYELFASETAYQKLSHQYKQKLKFRPQSATRQVSKPARSAGGLSEASSQQKLEKNDKPSTLLTLGKAAGMAGLIPTIIGGIFIILATHLLLGYILLGVGLALVLLGIASALKANTSKPSLPMLQAESSKPSGPSPPPVASLSLASYLQPNTGKSTSPKKSQSPKRK